MVIQTIVIQNINLYLMLSYVLIFGIVCLRLFYIGTIVVKEIHTELLLQSTQIFLTLQFIPHL